MVDTDSPPDGFDYSFARPDPPQMAAAGVKVTCRYLFDNAKGLTDPERRALHAAGLGIPLNYEANRGNHLKGAPQGVIDGADARRIAHRLGAPAGKPIYFACDQQVLGEDQHRATMAYLHAADSEVYPSRAYGQFSVVERFGRPAWQTVAWSNGQVSDKAVLYQYRIEQDFHGSAVDYNRIIDIDNLGAWWPEGSEHEMPTAREIVNELFERRIWGADKPTFIQTFRGISRALDDLDNTADKILARLQATGQAGGLTKADVRAAVREVFADAGTP